MGTHMSILCGNYDYFLSCGITLMYILTTITITSTQLHTNIKYYMHELISVAIQAIHPTVQSLVYRFTDWSRGPACTKGVQVMASFGL